MAAPNQVPLSIQAEMADLKSRLAETEETLDAIRQYMVDAFVVNRANGIEIVTLNKSDIPYRMMVESMNEGALTLIPDGTIFYCNSYFSEMVQIESERLISTAFRDLILPEQQSAFDTLFAQAGRDGLRGEFCLNAAAGECVPVQLSIYQLSAEGMSGKSIIATNISERMESERQIRSLASKLSIAEQEERHRISQILHDDLQQRLFALKAQLGLLNQADEKPGSLSMSETVTQLRDWLSQAINITRNLSIDLGPIVLQGEGLVESLKWLGLQMKSQYGLEVTQQESGEFQNIDTNIRVLLFQTVREILFNIVKHADTSQAEVILERVNDRAHITVRDAGKGFDAEGVLNDANSHGLLVIQDRLALVGGSMTVTSQPGAGTQVVIEVPMETHPA